jgi:apolipoprotein N-acyltransferase
VDLFMLALADAVILSSGWTRRFVALLAGAFGALALAPIGFGPALVVPMVVAVWLLDGSCLRAPSEGLRFVWPGLGALRLAFGAGWWLGFGYFLAGFWWLGAAFLIDPEFAWALPLGVVGLPAMLAIFMGVGFVIARLLWTSGAARILALALGLGLSEWMRGHLFTGFPWNPLAMGLGGWVVTAQVDAFIGLDGLTVLTVALCAAPATLCDSTRSRWRPTLVALAALAVLIGGGLIRLSGGTPGNVPGVTIRIVQPGLRPDEKFSPENKDKIVDHYIDLSRRDDVAKGVKLADVTMLVWPESAFPFILTRDPNALTTIGNALPPKTTLVTGAARQDDVPTDDGRAASVYYNAIEVIGSGGTVLDIYDKIHLVPFGEYLPLDGLLRRLGLHNFVAIPGGFEPGSVRRALTVPGLPPASPLICYEAIFPGEVMLSKGASGARPRYLLNVTNDGWFGTTAGPSQHFAQARLRAIEEGLPLVRGAATGISGIVDAYGRILDRLPLGEEGIVDGPLPQSIAAPFYARLGGLATWLVWLGTMVAYVLFRVTNRARA